MEMEQQRSLSPSLLTHWVLSTYHLSPYCWLTVPFLIFHTLLHPFKYCFQPQKLLLLLMIVDMITALIKTIICLLSLIFDAKVKAGRWWRGTLLRTLKTKPQCRKFDKSELLSSLTMLWPIEGEKHSESHHFLLITVHGRIKTAK